MEHKAEIIIRYEIKVSSPIVAEAIRIALLPDVSQIPEKCLCELGTQQGNITLILTCDDISKLRALNNSFIGVIIMMLEVLEVLTSE